MVQILTPHSTANADSPSLVASNLHSSPPLPANEKSISLHRRVIHLCSRIIQSQTYKDVNFTTGVTKKVVDIGKTVGNMVFKIQTALTASSGSAHVIDEVVDGAVKVEKELTNLQIFSNWFVKSAKCLFLFKIPKTIYEFFERCRELAQHKKPNRQYETCQAALGLLDYTGDLINYPADIASALVAFNVIDISAIAWATPLSIVGTLLNGATIIANSLHYQESFRFYQQMDKLVKYQPNVPYTVKDLVTLNDWIKANEARYSDYFLKRQFACDPTQFKPNLARISQVVDQVSKGADLNKTEEAKNIAHQVVSSLKQRVSVRITGSILAIAASVTGVFASIILTSLALAASAVVTSPIGIALTIIGLIFITTSLSLSLSKMIYERVHQNRLQKVFDQSLQWVNQNSS